MASTFPVFSGKRYMRGYGIGNLLGSIARSLKPIAKNVFKGITNKAINIGKRTLLDVAASRRSLGDSLKHNISSEIANTFANHPKETKKRKVATVHKIVKRPRKTKRKSQIKSSGDIFN